MKSKIRISKLRIKIFALITVFLIVPVTVCCFILFSITEKTLITYVSNNIDATLAENVRYIESKLDALDTASTSLLINLAKIPEITTDYMETDPVEIFRKAQYDFTVSSSLIVDTLNINGFYHFYLFFPQKSLLVVSKMSYFEGVNNNTLDCYTIPENSWGVSSSYDNLVNNPLMGKKMNDKNFSKNYLLSGNGNESGGVILTANLKEQYVGDQLLVGLQIKPDNAIIVDSHGNVFSSLSKQEIGESVPLYHQILSEIASSDASASYHEIEIEGKPYILNWQYSQKNDWYYTTVTDIGSITGSINIFDTMLLMICILVPIAFLITMMVVRSSMQPLDHLIHAMREMKNKYFKIQLPVNESDDFYVLYNGFNEMAIEIDHLVHKITEQNNLNTETNIRLLQSEINPHMLYNSLESLYSMAKINKQEEMSTLVMALSKFFRISLSGGKRLVPFREAFELANQYIIVQNIRMGYIIDFSYNIPYEYMDVLTPKFLLQPIVENAIQHGFKNSRKDCILKIHVTQDEGFIKINVWDNGIGIHESELNRLNKHINDFDFDGAVSQKGYALRNINYQLKLEFGDKCGMTIESVYGEYTSVVIKIPIVAKEG